MAGNVLKFLAFSSTLVAGLLVLQPHRASRETSAPEGKRSDALVEQPKQRIQLPPILVATHDEDLPYHKILYDNLRFRASHSVMCGGVRSRAYQPFCGPTKFVGTEAAAKDILDRISYVDDLSYPCSAGGNPQSCFDQSANVSQLRRRGWCLQATPGHDNGEVILWAACSTLRFNQ